MRHIGLTILVVVGLTGGSALGQSAYFEENVATAGDYLWGTNDNWNPVGATGSLTEARIGVFDVDGNDAPVATPLAAVVNSDQIARNLRIAGGSSLTVNGGTLDIVHDPAEGPTGMLSMGQVAGLGAGTLNLNGGVINANTGNDYGVHGVVHVARYEDGTLNQTGGTLNVLGVVPPEVGTRGEVGTVAISAMGATGRGVYNMSGGTLNAHQLLLPHNSATMGGEFHISGDAVVNIIGTTWVRSGIMMYDGGTLSVTGGNASININQDFQLGGWYNNPGTFTIVFNIDATGASTMNMHNLLARGKPTQFNNLELSASGAAPDTYTLFHTEVDPTMYAGTLVMSGAGFSNLQVVDVNLDGSVSGYDITVDYIPEPATMLLLTIGGLGVLLRKRR